MIAASLLAFVGVAHAESLYQLPDFPTLKGARFDSESFSVEEGMASIIVPRNAMSGAA